MLLSMSSVHCGAKSQCPGVCCVLWMSRCVACVVDVPVCGVCCGCPGVCVVCCGCPGVCRVLWMSRCVCHVLWMSRCVPCVVDVPVCAVCCGCPGMCAMCCGCLGVCCQIATTQRVFLFDILSIGDDAAFDGGLRQIMESTKLQKVCLCIYLFLIKVVLMVQEKRIKPHTENSNHNIYTTGHD